MQEHQWCWGSALLFFFCGTKKYMECNRPNHVSVSLMWLVEHLWPMRLFLNHVKDCFPQVTARLKHSEIWPDLTFDLGCDLWMTFDPCSCTWIIYRIVSLSYSLIKATWNLTWTLTSDDKSNVILFFLGQSYLPTKFEGHGTYVSENKPGPKKNLQHSVLKLYSTRWSPKPCDVRF